MQFLKLLIVCFSIFNFSGCAGYKNMSESQKQEFWGAMATGLNNTADAMAEQNRKRAAEQEEQRRRQVNCTTNFLGCTAYTTCR